ncbi:MAG: DUF4416 family protein [Firmicutes bacterium]|nr:DUF4416 family protein [Bacillota bacterium]
MSDIRTPKPVKYFVGMISNNEELFEKAMEKLKPYYGEFDIVSESVPFDFTDYYHPEMGEGLKRKFASFEKLMDPGILPDMKILTNKIEEEFAHTVDENGYKRSVNIDPGYLNEPKMILASTKDFSHRIYLRDGIFAEITLFWRNKQYQHWEWTFPDYRTQWYKDWFTSLRKRYLEQVKK